MNDKSGWTKWMPLNDANVRNVSVSRGLYQVGAVGEGGGPSKICRLNGTDEEGIIYMGGSTKLRERLKGWLGPRKHHASRHWLLCQTILEQGIPRYEARFRVRVGDPHEDLEKAEANALADYFLKFAELPPCNALFRGNIFALFLERVRVGS